MRTRVGGWVLGLLVLVGCGDDDVMTSDMSTDECAADADCSDGAFCNGTESCVDGVCNPGVPPCMAGEECDEAADTCAVPCQDLDDDGYADIACGGIDCDDSDPNRYPGNTEICDVDGRDEDCDPRTFGYRDQDMDGRPDDVCCNGDNCGTDCDDTDPTVGMDGEICDGKDNDCNSLVDDLAGGGSCACTVIGETRDCGPSSDLDGVGICRTGTETCAGGVWVCEGAVNPAEDELCNALDDDCDGMVDETFSCIQGMATTCDVIDDRSFPEKPQTCSTAGSTTCTALCEVGECTASVEDCDYCDDDGDGLDDEFPLTMMPAQVSLLSAPCSEFLSRGGSADCSTRVVATAGSRGSSTDGLYFSNPFTLGYGPTVISGFIQHSGSCLSGGGSVFIYRVPGAGSHALGDPYGSDTGEHGAIFTFYPQQTAAGNRIRGGLGSTPSGASATGTIDGSDCSGFTFDFTIEPHSPIGLSGVTRYRVEAELMDEMIVGPALYPGDMVRIGMTATASPSTTWTATVLNVNQENVCP
ncbi:MAG: putative metal-binding motif-containing protein [Deltaproteobacteria bacterium]|nr:putative metal-binding motif-containing protein [Deltaproteobacteria bacterium]